MKIYLEAVPRLPRLECVEFYDIRNWDSGNVEEAITFVREHDRFAIRSQRRFQKDATQAVVGQASSHDNVHEEGSEKMMMAKLIEIKLGGSGDSGIIQTTELYKILQAMQHPKVVDLTEWKGAVMDIMQIPVKTLQVLKMRLDRPLPKTCPLGNFLLRARSLRELQISIAPTHGRLFRWAVKRMQVRKQMYKMARESQNGSQGRTSEVRDLTGTVSMDGAKRRQGRFQQCISDVKEEGLEVLSLAGETATVVQALNAAAWGFSNTLKTLHANTWKENSGLQFEDVAVGVAPQADNTIEPGLDDNMDPTDGDDDNTDEGSSDGSTGVANNPAGPLSSIVRFSFNHKIPMIRLHTLELKGEVATIALDFQSLRHCPQLCTLRLNTRPCRVEPDIDAVDKILANVPGSLTDLEFIGLWWITDHHLNQIAKCLSKLRRLRIGHAPSFYTITPMSTPIMSYQSPESLSCAGIAHAVEQLRELRELWLGVDMDYYRRRRERNSGSSMLSFFSRRIAGNEKEEDIWATLVDTIGHQSEKRVIPLAIEIQHCPT
ncbi:hypothetical protein BGZ80_009597 [Entomortierella chlamydospora]|uniref:Uncharacterized protein n=1 Tax=Entomortierella chlamydospora TaxID=101097 RepID=A0A9P6T465_9FUNG|nr:hypothetical protein BGZ79_007855 [Entomortierella chlamydospora]KAG0023370.1 hypothetical protein BGZ80_009597 [Entomortierella chlamydospora]